MNNGVITSTDFHFPAQASVYKGKVRDVYTVGDHVIMVATDRISAFDVILPRAIPYKGQVLNQLASFFLEKTADIAPNWLIGTPDPNVSIGKKLEPFKVEMIVRGGLVGHAWREYSAGKREICGAAMPDGLQEFDLFPRPIITPSTKADEGHDEDITGDEIVARGLATADEYARLTDTALRLFARGQELAARQGLILMDTKYEFGKDTDGTIYVIDEVHTPDSSRYFYKESYDAYQAGSTTDTPRHLSKEFVREWLMDNGFSGQTGQTVPEMTDEFVTSVSDRYIELYEIMVGAPFVPADVSDPLGRIESAITAALKELSA